MLRKTVLHRASITSTSGQVLQADWNASDLVTVLDGSDVELRLVSVVGNVQTAGALAAYNSQGTALINATLAQAGLTSWCLPIRLVISCSYWSCCGTPMMTRTSPASTRRAGRSLAARAMSMAQRPVIAKLGLGWKIGNGSETAVNITTAGGAATDLLLARVMRFTAANGFAATAVANLSTPTSGTGTTVSLPTVNPGGALNRLALAAFVFSVSTSFGTVSGETGGDWTDSGAGVATTNGAIGFMRSDQSGGGSVSGGTFTVTSSDWVGIGFTVEPGLIAGAAESTVEIGAIEWNARYLTPVGPSDVGLPILGTAGIHSAIFGGAIVR